MNETSKANKKCALCRRVRKLSKSHIIPSFVFKWLKNTSLTGFLRHRRNLNLRQQDGIKLELLCSECESLFSSYEKLFERRIFTPYVRDELDKNGVAQGILKSFKYGNWFIKFIVSVQWRCLHIPDFIKDDMIKRKPLRPKTLEILGNMKDNWRRFLSKGGELDQRRKHYIIFLQNIAYGKGSLPGNISKHLVRYLLRTVDTTVASSTNDSFIYTKLGPVVIVTSVEPGALLDMEDYSIKKSGEISTIQHLSDHDLNNFIFVQRPKEAMEGVNFSPKQQEKITLDTVKNLEKSSDSLSVVSMLSDSLLGERIGIQQYRDSLGRNDICWCGSGKKYKNCHLHL